MRRRRTFAGLVLVAVFLGAVLVLIRVIPLAMPFFLGLEAVGRLEDTLPPDPSPLAADGLVLDRLVLVMPPRLTEPLDVAPADLGAVVIGDATIPGVSLYHLTLYEGGFNIFLQDRLFPDSVIGDRFRELRVDFQPGGLVVYAEVKLGPSWQPVGLLLLQEGETGLVPAGLVMDGRLYSLPEEGDLADIVPRATGIVEQGLEGLTLTGPLPGEARISQVRFHANRVEVLAQATYTVEPAADVEWQVLNSGVDLRTVGVPTGSVVELVTLVRLDPARVRFRVRYEPGAPRPISAWGEQYAGFLVVNGGYFTPENQATALLISGGRVAGFPLGDYAGMFAVTATGEVGVRWLRERPYDPQEGLVEAIQSFPVLVKPGGVMGFPADADEGQPARRTVVAQDTGGRILILVAPRGYLSLHELAVFLASSDLEIDVALNLDGGGSTGLWLETGDTQVTIDSVTPVPSVIVAEW